MLFLRSIFFTLLIPGSVTVLFPYLLLSGRRPAMVPHWGVAQYLGLPLLVLGAGVLLRCIWDFAVAGHGTLAPIDPPTDLVVRGLYRYVRNPMYVGVVTILLGEAMLFESMTMVVYAGGFLTLTHLFVVLYEEPALKGQFGESYGRYCRQVRRWLPGIPRRPL